MTILPSIDNYLQKKTRFALLQKLCIFSGRGLMWDLADFPTSASISPIFPPQGWKLCIANFSLLINLSHDNLIIRYFPTTTESFSFFARADVADTTAMDLSCNTVWKVISFACCDEISTVQRMEFLSHMKEILFYSLPNRCRTLIKNCSII